MAITIMYPISLFLGYFLHSKYSFSYSGNIKNGVAKFIVANFCGYLLNLLIIYVFYDLLSYPHQIVQIFALFVVYLFLFWVLKNYTFNGSNNNKPKKFYFN